MEVLVVAAHPDDTELLCAGTLALLARAGHSIHIGHLTYGDKGGRDDPAELARIRGAEAAASASIIGAATLGRICGDLELYLDDEHIAAVRDLVDGVEADVILTHRPDDYHPDHRIAGELVLAATSPRRTRPSVWFMDTIGGVGFDPTHYVDIGSVLEIKQRMIRCHESQMNWMSAARHTDMTYMIEWTGRWRGLQCGRPVAEGYIAAGDPETPWFAPDLESVPFGMRKDVA